ncbi:MAG: DUF2326 domain-containing protein [Deltaproteobacteria bacterium]|nr:DUF2326 domain-containing protein [Deltaproteobacteria bacterium]
MILRRVFANVASFRAVSLEPGFNVVLADTTRNSSERDSRNGLGKTLLLEVVHFCLGSKAVKGQGVCVPALEGWEFSLEMEVAGRNLTVTRRTNDPRWVLLAGANLSLPVPVVNHPSLAQPAMPVDDWNRALGAMTFGLPTSGQDKYAPSFRSLFSYFARKSRGSALDPFAHFERQHEWDKQVHNAYLLGLRWETASELQFIKDRKAGLKSFKSAIKAGVVKGYAGTLADLEAKRVRLEADLERRVADLDAFRVHEQFREIEQEADRLTQQIHSVSDDNFGKRRLLTTYRRSLEEEAPPGRADVARLYAEAGVALPDAAKRRLMDVDAFHVAVVSNRRSFLDAECQRLEREIAANDARIHDLSTARATHMEILKTHRALDEYTRLQNELGVQRMELASLRTLVENMRQLREGEGEVRLQQAQTVQVGRRDFDERASVRDQAIRLFNDNSQFLYEAPGKLLVDFEERGFRFRVEIERAGSDGIEQMKVFCFDLMLAQLWATRDPSPRFLFHDSRLFDGVDERQRARALILAQRESHQRGFQYIVTLNSDAVPTSLLGNFSLDQYMRLRLTDSDPAGCLLGIRF